MGDTTFRVTAGVPSVTLPVEPPRTADATRPALLVTVKAVDITGAIVRVTGELDLAATDMLTAALNAQLDAGRRDVLIDMSDLAFCSCAGLGSLVASHHRFVAAGGTLTLTGFEGCVGRLLRLTDLDQFFATSEAIPGARTG